jgi:hypothetical protein
MYFCDKDGYKLRTDDYKIFICEACDSVYKWFRNEMVPIRVYYENRHEYTLWNTINTTARDWFDRLNEGVERSMIWKGRNSHADMAGALLVLSFLSSVILGFVSMYGYSTVYGKFSDESTMGQKIFVMSLFLLVLVVTTVLVVYAIIEHVIYLGMRKIINIAMVLDLMVIGISGLVYLSYVILSLTLV